MKLKFKGTAKELKTFLAKIDKDIESQEQSIQETNEFLMRKNEEQMETAMRIYRNSETIADFDEQVKESRINPDIAHEVYTELNEKYNN